MTLSLEAFRALFPALERVVYLNTASVAPAPAPVRAAIDDLLDRWSSGEFSWQSWEADTDATRASFAELIGVDEFSVALMSSVAEAASTVAASLPPGRVVVGEREFHSNLLPWLALRDRGFDVALVPFRDGVLRTEDLVASIDERTVLVAVSEVQSSNGGRVLLEEVAARAREVGSRLFVDGIQSLGALRFDATRLRPDFVAAQGYKWLTGPRGLGWLHVREDRLPELRPLLPNWHSLLDPFTEYYGPVELAPDARRLGTSPVWLSGVGARAALEVIGSLDPEAVERRCLGLAASFREGAAERGFRCVATDAPTHIVSVDVPDPRAVKARLAERRVIGALRSGLLRLGFHAFNDEGDVDAALDALGTAGAEG